MVEVSLGEKEKLGVSPAIAEPFHAGFDLRGRRFEIRIDQDVSSRCGDQVGSEVPTTDIVKIVSDTEGCNRRRPFWMNLCGRGE